MRFFGIRGVFNDGDLWPGDESEPFVYSMEDG